MQEKLEHCLGSRPSIGQDIDGESISHLRSLAAKHDIFNAAVVGVAYNIANFSYSDHAKGRLVMVRDAPPPPLSSSSSSVLDFSMQFRKLKIHLSSVSVGLYTDMGCTRDTIQANMLL